jgi:hypothetical protein
MQLGQAVADIINAIPDANAQAAAAMVQDTIKRIVALFTFARLREMVPEAAALDKIQTWLAAGAGNARRASHVRGILAPCRAEIARIAIDKSDGRCVIDFLRGDGPETPLRVSGATFGDALAQLAAAVEGAS